VHLDIIKVFYFTNGCTIYLFSSALNFNVNFNVLVNKYIGIRLWNKKTLITHELISLNLKIYLVMEGAHPLPSKRNEETSNGIHRLQSSIA